MLSAHGSKARATQLAIEVPKVGFGTTLCVLGSAALDTEEGTSSGDREMTDGGRGSALSNRNTNSGRDAKWDAVMGINPTAWVASIKRTPQLLRQRAFRTRTLEDCLEVCSLHY